MSFDEHKTEHKATKIVCECGLSYSVGHMARHKSSVRHIKLLNKEISLPVAGETKTEYAKRRWAENKDNLKESGSDKFTKKQAYLKEYRAKNRDDINKKRTIKCVCECGLNYTHGNVKRHLASKKHLNLMNMMN